MSNPKIITGIEQGTDAWFELRRGIPTASNFNKLITDVKMQAASEKGLNTYAAELMSQHWRCEESLFKTPYTERGKRLEPKVIEWYEWEMDIDAQSVGFVFDSDEEQYGCSPDSLIGDIGGVEIKCPKSENHWSLVFKVTGKDSWQPLFTGTARIANVPRLTVPAVDVFARVFAWFGVSVGDVSDSAAVLNDLAWFAV